MVRFAFTLCVLAECVAAFTYQKTADVRECPYGWKHIGRSCYQYQKWRMQFDRAEVMCLQQGSTLFVADTVEEWNEVMKHAPTNAWIWAGLYQEQDEREPRWKYPGGIEPSKINWLRSSKRSDDNGFSENAKCVAHYNSPTKPYAYFHYCGAEYHSICEKNNTLLQDIWDHNAGLY